MAALNLAELGLIAEHLWLRADLDRYDENSPPQLFVHCPFDEPHAVSDSVLGLDCTAGVVVRICELCELEVEDSFAEVAQGLREASVDYVAGGRAAYVGVADLLEGAERPRSRSAPLYLVGVAGTVRQLMAQVSAGLGCAVRSLVERAWGVGWCVE